jgi:hypothetical protein
MFAAVHEGRLQSVSSPSKTSRRSLTPDRVWNRIPDDIRQRIVSRALDQPELSPRESACCRGLAYHRRVPLPPGLRGAVNQQLTWAAICGVAAEGFPVAVTSAVQTTTDQLPSTVDGFGPIGTCEARHYSWV